MFPRFVCKDYVVGASDTIVKRSCSLDSTSSKLSCPKTPPGGSKLPTPAPRPSSVTNKPPTSPPRSPSAPSGPCLRSGKNCEEGVVTITSFEVQTAADGTEDPITAGVRTRPLATRVYVLFREYLRNHSLRQLKQQKLRMNSYFENYRTRF